MQIPSILSAVTHTVTQKQINQYARASGDYNPLHIDQEFASTTPYGKTLAHGMLILALLSEFMTQTFGTAWTSGGKLKVRFREPVFAGTQISFSGKLRIPIHDSNEVTYELLCQDHNGTNCVTGEAHLVIK